MCLRARLSQDNTERMFFLLTMGAGHTRLILYMLTMHKRTDLGMFPTAIPSMEGCGDSKWELKVHAQPYRRLSTIFSALSHFFLCNTEIQEYFSQLQTRVNNENLVKLCMLHISGKRYLWKVHSLLCVHSNLCFGEIHLPGVQTAVLE